MSSLSEEIIDDFLLSCRYGETDEVKAFAEQYGWEAVAGARDDRGNTALHMCCGNGHADILQILLPHLPPALLRQTNHAGTPPLHWAILNNHVSAVKILAELPEEQGGGLPLLNQINRSGRDAFAESIFAGEGKEEVAGWIEGFFFKAEGGEDMAPEEIANGEGEAKIEGEGAEEGGMQVEVEVEEVKQGDRGAEEEAIKELQEKAADVRIGGT